MSANRLFSYCLIFHMTLGIFLVSCSSDDTVSENPATLTFFTNVIDDVGIGDVGVLGQTSAWGDFDSDGHQDLIIANTDFLPPNVFLFKNNGNGTFTDVTIESSIFDIPLRSVAWGDYDNDGLLDLAVGTIAAGAPPILYKNLDGISFEDVSTEAGITAVGGVTTHTIWVDYDLDGDIDLFDTKNGVSMLYSNQGDGTFIEASSETNLGEFLITNSAIWCDFNNDGFPDPFLANDGENRFYINNGGADFTDITVVAGLSGDISWDSISACVGDYNNDGFLDLYVGNIGSTRNALYRNNGNGTFTDVTLETGTEDLGDGRTCAWVDFDADGKTDLLSTNHIGPTKFFRNLGNAKFVDVAEDTELILPIDVFAATWGDYNNDGFMDVFLNGHLGIALNQNTGNSNNFVITGLVGDGVTTNTSAVGTRVEVLTSNGSQIKEVLGGKGCCEQDMLPLHFGVGTEVEIDIFVMWTSGDECFFEDFNVEGGRRFLISQDLCEILEL